jgi:hypothetical protein
MNWETYRAQHARPGAGTCENCGNPGPDEVCEPCLWLMYCERYPNPSWDRSIRSKAFDGVVNRRWQFRFWRGEI